MFYDDLVEYYKWDQQDWWNGEDGEQDMVAIIANDFWFVLRVLQDITMK